MSDETRTPVSYPTLIGGAVAAATATALSTRLGLVGTILGAVLASVVSTIVTTVFANWIERLRGAARDREPSPYWRLVVGAAAIALVATGFHAGIELVTADLPRDEFTMRLLHELGITPQH